MNREHSRDALEAALRGVAGVPANGGDGLPWPPAGPERSWVLTGQGAADKRRAQGSSGRLRRLLVGQALPRGGEGQWGDFSRAMGAMERRAVTEALTALPSELREVVRLAYFEGKSNRAVADNLGLSVAGVRRRLRQALRLLEHGLRRAGSSLSGTLLGIGSSWLDRAPRGRELVAAAAGTAAATSAAVLLAGSPTLAVAGAPSHHAPAADLNTSSASSVPTNPGAVAAAAPAPAAAPAVAAPSLVSAPLQVPLVQTVVQVTEQVTEQVTSALPPPPAIKPPGL